MSDLFEEVNVRYIQIQTYSCLKLDLFLELMKRWTETYQVQGVNATQEQHHYNTLYKVILISEHNGYIRYQLAEFM